jgi:hypothetical protein
LSVTVANLLFVGDAGGKGVAIAATVYVAVSNCSFVGEGASVVRDGGAYACSSVMDCCFSLPEQSAIDGLPWSRCAVEEVRAY